MSRKKSSQSFARHGGPRPQDSDTIASLMTPIGRGAIHVIRVSGSSTYTVIRKMAPFLPQAVEGHKLYFGRLRSASGDLLDEVLIACFTDGRSFTGEDSVEISCHGNPVIVDLILETLRSYGVRASQRGEFSYRAFLNGKMDLVQAEGLQSLIMSESPVAVSRAWHQMAGRLSKKMETIRNDILWNLAQIEAVIDFSTEDIQPVCSEELFEYIKSLSNKVRQLVKSYSRRSGQRYSFRIALVGPPNSGKSSLFNALLDEDRAIVSATAGTTRDSISAYQQEKGLQFEFLDTAGLRQSGDTIEKIGVERTQALVEQADLVCFVADHTQETCEWTLEEDFFISNSEGIALKVPLEKFLLVFSKRDLLVDREGFIDEASVAGHWVSSKTGEGINELRQKFVDRFSAGESSGETLLIQERHYELMKNIEAALSEAMSLIKNEESPELIAVPLQECLSYANEILGIDAHEDVIDRIFQEFCLGK